MEQSSSSSSSWSPQLSSAELAYDMEKTESLDVPLHSIGFYFQELTPKRVTGHMLVTTKCVQPFKVLHGGVSALIAEGMASVGAHIAAGFQRVAGIHLSINHHKSATIGDLILGEAIPINVGKTIQVWEVRLYKVVGGGGGGPSSSSSSEEKKGEERVLVASSKVTLLSNMPVPDNARDAGLTLRKYARL